MKLPYREGDIFALPLGDGSSAQAQIVACGHHTVDVVVRSGASALPAVRVSDRALVLQRWRPHARAAVSDPGAAPGAYWIGPARFERAIATRLGIAQLDLPPLVVRRGDPPPPGNVARRRLKGRGVIELIGERAMRIARVERYDLAQLRDVPLESLWLESIADLRGIETLFGRSDLRQLEMLDFWTFGLDEVMPLVGLPNLVRAEIDIGGRRKNVELNRRANWAYPWPAEVTARLRAAQ